MHNRLRAVSLFLESLWERTENKQACERDCERDVGAAMPRAASSVGVGRRQSNAHATRGSRHRRSHVTFTVTFARLLVLRSFQRIFEEKRDCSQS